MTRPFSAIWVVGLGTTGSALVSLFARSGFSVVGVERDTAALDLGRARVRRRVASAAATLGLSTAERAQCLSRIEYTVQTELISAADLVIEAVPEQLDLKLEVLRWAHSLCPEDTVFATTSTGLSITEIASLCGRMERTVGLHMADCDSAEPGGILEVVHTPVTDAWVRDRLCELLPQLGKTAISTGDHPGFTGAALIMKYLNGAAAMYAKGNVSREDIDAVMTLGWGFPKGPLAHLDSIGLDVARDTLQALYERSEDPEYLPATIITHLVTAGRLGRKTGHGFHRYDASDVPGLELSDATLLEAELAEVKVTAG
jgi:3-hydroxybutyryl-CoA dehydrogenase